MILWTTYLNGRIEKENRRVEEAEERREPACVLDTHQPAVQI